MDKEPLPLPEVVCLVFFRNGRFLLEQRLDDDSFYGKWTFTGGKVEINETIERASVREADEETGLIPTLIQPFTTFKGVSRNGNSFVFHGIWIPQWSGRLKNKEGAPKRKLKWVSLEQVRKYIDDTEVDRRVLEAFLAHQATMR